MPNKKVNTKKADYSARAAKAAQTRKTNNIKKLAMVSKKAENKRSMGVLIMLIGLFLAIWFIFIYGEALGEAQGFAADAKVFFAMLGNMAIALAVFYAGLLMFRQKEKGHSRWVVLGWFFFLFAYLGLMHLSYCENGFLKAFKLGINGVGGGICGAVSAFPASLIPGETFPLVVLWAFVVLGLILGTDLKIFKFFPWLYNKLRDSRPTLKEKQQEEVLTKPAPETKKNMQKEFSAPPIITDYDAKIYEAVKDSAEITIGEFLDEPETLAGEPCFIREVMPQVSPAKTIPVKMNTKDLEPVTEAELEKEDVLVNKLSATNESSANKTVSEQHDTAVSVNHTYIMPPLSILKSGIKVRNSRINKEIMDNSIVLEEALNSFGVKAKVVEVVSGPAVTRYELQPAPGVKVAKIVNLADDIALTLAAKGLRIEAPVPGKSVVGIEIAKPEVTPVYLKDVIDTPQFSKSKAKLSLALGVDITGTPVIGDLSGMPHLLIAGSTGSGKSVCINTLICSILYKATPQEVKIIMIDPKKVELSNYNGLPHLARPVVTNPKKAAAVLKETVNEMERRYSLFAAAGVKNYTQYNAESMDDPLPQIVVLIDELADLMMVASHDVEDAICRLAQMARAAGIHLVVATQRPSVDVITGLIKANIPSRIAFAVSSQIDSRTILDMGGAEKLLGKGDMLFYPVGSAKPVRVQGAFLTEKEIKELVAYCSKQAHQEFIEFPEAAPEEANKSLGPQDDDELFYDAVQQVIMSSQASASFLQRRFRIGYNRAARLIESMEQLQIVSPPEGNKRQVLMDMETFTGMYGIGE